MSYSDYFCLLLTFVGLTIFLSFKRVFHTFSAALPLVDMTVVKPRPPQHSYSFKTQLNFIKNTLPHSGIFEIEILLPGCSPGNGSVPLGGAHPHFTND